MSHNTLPINLDFVSNLANSAIVRYVVKPHPSSNSFDVSFEGVDMRLTPGKPYTASARCAVVVDNAKIDDFLL